MSTEQTESTAQQPADAPQPAAAAEWGAPPPPAAPKSKWTVKRTVIAVAVAVGIAAAGGVAIYAASGSVTNNQGGPGGGPGGGNGRVFMGGPMAGLEESQHGEFQIGEVTAISDDSITAKSKDGYEQTYVINSDTQKSDDLAKGDSVTIIGTESNGTVTAVSVLEEGAFGNRQNGNGGTGGPPNGGGNGGTRGGNPPNGNN
jgi:hypothetical protein